MAEQTIRVHRYDPAVDDAPEFESYQVEVSEATSVLDGLFRIQEDLGENLSFRFSCRQGVCGSCSMEIDGKARLACQTPVSELGETISVRPMYNLPVVKDLVVDMDPFFDSYEEAFLQFESDELDEETDTAVVPPDSREREVIDPRTDCVGCGACYSGCSVAGETYLGPAAINRALTLIEDSRDDRSEERLERLMESDGVWGCHTQGNCTEVCPKDIPISRGIQYLKREAAKHGMKRKLVPGSGD